MNIWVESLGYWTSWVMKRVWVCNEPRHASTQMDSFISTFSRRCICWLLTNQTKHKQFPNRIAYSPQLKDSWFINVSVSLEWLPRNPLLWLSVLLILAWVVFVDNNKTITVIRASIECVCQLLWQVLCRQGLIHSHYGALIMTDFSWGSQVSEEGGRLPPVHRPQFAETDFLWSFCVCLQCHCFLLSGSGILPANHFHFRTSVV